MAYQISLSYSARSDLHPIVDYIALDTSEKALSIGRQLIASTRLLSSFPEMERIVPEFKSPNVREIIFRPYRIIYRVLLSDY